MGGLKVVTLRDQQPHTAAVTADRRLWLTADRQAVVEDGDPRAAFLLATPGTEIARAEAERLGLIQSPADKERTKPEDKERTRPEDK